MPDNQDETKNTEEDYAKLKDQLESIFESYAQSLDDYGPLKSLSLSKMTTKLFGLPYQFSKYIDPRVKGVSDHFGRHFLTSFLTDAPILTIQPGKPKYLKQNSLSKLMVANLDEDQESSSLLTSLINLESNSDDRRFYDFQQSYTRYFQYVNVLCRACAIFMEIGDKKGPDGNTKLSEFDWKNYRFDGTSYNDVRAASFKNAINLAGDTIYQKILMPVQGQLLKYFETVKGFGEEVGAEVQSFLRLFEDAGENTTNEDSVEEDGTEGTTDDSSTTIDTEEIEELCSSNRYIQFYIDAVDSNVNESIRNDAGESKFESIQSSLSDLAKEIGFLVDSGGVTELDSVKSYVSEGMASIEEQLASSSSGSLTKLFQTLLNSFSSSLIGESIAFPQIWKGSSFEKSYTIKIKLRAVYGDKMSYYLDVMVPLLHLLALALPKQSTANSFGSPFLCRLYYPGIFSCNMGLVTSLEIDKHSQDTSWTIDGFPNEIDVTLQVSDLYSDLSMSSSSDPKLFINNSSLLTYLGTMCGIDYTAPSSQTKMEQFINAERKAGEETGANATIYRILGDQFLEVYDDLKSMTDVGGL